jgi:predicted protein tyrosine phosphatase
MKKPKILCICAKGINRSRYLAAYLRRKGYSTRSGGVEPYENPKYKWKPTTQKQINWADIIIVIRKRLISIIDKKFNIKNKKIIILDVTDSKRLIPDEFKELKNLDLHEFNLKWTYPQLRKAIKQYLPLKK